MPTLSLYEMIKGGYIKVHHGNGGIKSPPEHRFWDHVTKDGPIHPVCGRCWRWHGYREKNWYGRIQVDGYRHKAHRYSWILHYGEIEEGLMVLHKCDNPECTNPKHLFLGKWKENSDDMISKGRDRKCRGVDHHKAVLTEDQVLAIRKKYKKGVRGCGTPKLAKEFGVTQGLIMAIVSRKCWKHI